MLFDSRCMTDLMYLKRISVAVGDYFVPDFVDFVDFV